jgi:hypothetical protein
MSVIFFQLETVATNIDQMLHHSIAVHGQQAIINRLIDRSPEYINLLHAFSNANSIHN